MIKPTLTVLGLSLALALASGCARGFDANDTVPGSARKGILPKVDPNQEKAIRKNSLSVIEQQMKSDVVDRNKTVKAEDQVYLVDDISDKASKMIEAVSAKKIGANLNIAVIVKAEDKAGTDSLRVDFNIPRMDTVGEIIDGKIVFSTEQNVEVTAVKSVLTEESKAALKKQFQAIFICSNSCQQISVRLQFNAENGKASPNDYATMLDFDFAKGSAEGQLKSTTMKVDATAIGAVDAFVTKLLAADKSTPGLSSDEALRLSLEPVVKAGSATPPAVEAKPAAAAPAASAGDAQDPEAQALDTVLNGNF